MLELLTCAAPTAEFAQKRVVRRSCSESAEESMNTSNWWEDVQDQLKRNKGSYPEPFAEE